jgi:phosphoribosylformylglycinamidine synthase
MMAIPGLVVGIQDMGAAGLTCSTCETASRGNAGIEIDLDLVPQRETGMNSYEIMLSESQERMLVIVQKGREKELEEVFEKWDLYAAHIGEVKEGDRMVVRHKGVVVADLPAKSLTDEAPVYDQPATEPPHVVAARDWSPSQILDISANQVESSLKNLLSHPTIASKRWVWQQYDHMVMSGCKIEPGSDAGVVRLSIAGIDKYLAIANDCNNRFCQLDPYKGAQIAFVECMRNLACSGAKALAVTDNLNFGNPNKPEAYFMLKECVKGLADACTFFDVPVVGGNVSLYNEHGEGSIDPTPVVSMVGLIDHQDQVTRSQVQEAGLELLLLGGWSNELGGSYYLQTEYGKKEGSVPKLNLENEMKLQKLLISQIESGKIKAAHDLSEGGFMVCLAEMLFGSNKLGLSLSIPVAERLDATLFGESQGRVIVAVNPSDSEDLITFAQSAGVQIDSLGTTDKTGILKVNFGKEEVLDVKVDELHLVWENAIPQHMESSKS